MELKGWVELDGILLSSRELETLLHSEPGSVSR